MREERASALSYAALSLGLRPMTRMQLLRKLAEKGYGEEEAREAADRMEELGALDDLEYALQFVRDKSAAGFGSLRIRQELRQRGVAADRIEEALETMDESGESGAAIERFIESRLKGRVPDRAEAKKIADALARKGFKWDDISPILQKYLEED